MTAGRARGVGLCVAVTALTVLSGPAALASTTLRVGLATDLEAVAVPRSAQPLIAEAAGREVARLSTMQIEPAGEVVSPPVFRLQVAALKDERQAHGLADQLRRRHGERVDVVFDAGSDLYRIRLGSFPNREQAETAQRRLQIEGLSQTWIVSEKGEIGRAQLRIRHGESSFMVPGRWLSLRSSAPDGGVRVQGGAYRGRILVFLNDRGLLNVINELSVEDYLRGVVPKEMGPVVYDQLEALKAQTVAARTYTLKNLGEFLDEGYDICATPRCQVYGGMGDEHPLTDRAIAETADEVMVFRGDLVEALYSSTCGGHTENVEVIFPLKNQPYLKGVACLEAGVDMVNGNQSRGMLFPQGLMHRIVPPTSPSFTPQTVGARFEQLALLAGLPIPEDRLASMERREVQRFIASIFDMALDVRLFVARAELDYLLDQPPADWSERDLLLAAYLIKSGLLEGELGAPLSAVEIENTLFRLALHLHVVEAATGRYMGSTSREISLRDAEGATESFRLGTEYGTYRRNGTGMVGEGLSLLAGDPVGLYLRAGQVLAVTQEAEVDGVSFDRTGRRSSWSRYRSDAELRRLVQERYPGLGFTGLEVLARGVSGRVGRLRIIGDAGRSTEVEGLAVRWTLDLPDTLFTAKRLTPPDRPPGWLFSGRGWGHGVGMCQVGAFGMAQRGHSYRDILRHYYSGVEIVPAARSTAIRSEPAAP